MSLINLQPILLLSEGDPEFRASLLEKYVSNFTTFADDLEKPLMEGRTDYAKMTIHKVKASIRMIEGDAFDRVLENLDYAMRQGALTPAVAQEYVERIRQMSAQVVLEITQQSQNL